MSEIDRIGDAAPFLRAIVDDARRCLALDRVVLFGSRGRGDADCGSDYDLAFEHRSTDAQWCAFVNRIQEEAPTLADLDLVDLGQASEVFKERILREGVVLHG